MQNQIGHVNAFMASRKAGNDLRANAMQCAGQSKDTIVKSQPSEPLPGEHLAKHTF